nr:hypothetical protein CTI12_AA354860 [Tanacetum cinerariifolium]
MLTDADPGPNYAKIMDEYISKKEANLPTRIQMVSEPDRAAKSANKAKKGNLTELEVVPYGYQFFKKFKGLVVDMIFSRRKRNQSRDFFLNRTAKDAFKVVEVELNFIYEVSLLSFPWCFIYLEPSAGFYLWRRFVQQSYYSYSNKTNFSDADVTITYGLLFGALVLDMTALIMLLFLDWTIISLRESPDDERVKQELNSLFASSSSLSTDVVHLFPMFVSK